MISFIIKHIKRLKVLRIRKKGYIAFDYSLIASLSNFFSFSHPIISIMKQIQFNHKMRKQVSEQDNGAIPVIGLMLLHCCNLFHNKRHPSILNPIPPGSIGA